MPADKDYVLAGRVAEKVNEHGGCVYFVGGCVRDSLMGLECKDTDIEVHGISKELLENILSSIGEVLSFGKSFGVYNIKGYGVDIALPRTETLTGTKHTDFKIDTNPFLGTKKAAARRDFTINAIMRNALTGEIIDHFGGVDDIKNRVIRHVNDNTFTEDPLRVFRAAQFASRFDFTITPETEKLCSSMYLADISCERVFKEMEKALLKAEKPSVFFKSLLNMNCMSIWFPEIEELTGIEQNAEFHPEGNVFIHTMMVLDEAAKRRSSAKNPLGLMLSALVHDLGKLVATEMINGRIHAYSHETKGLPIIEKFLRRITSDKALTGYVLNMAELHMKPNVLFNAMSSVKASNKMFDASIEPHDLILLAISDISGTHSAAECEASFNFLNERLEIFNEYMQRPYVMGKDLADAGIEPGEKYRVLLSYAHKLRLAGVSKASALRQVLAYERKL